MNLKIWASNGTPKTFSLKRRQAREISDFHSAAVPSAGGKREKKNRRIFASLISFAWLCF